MSRYEDAACAKIQQRAEHGLAKYGLSVERTDLSRLDWLRHAQEEAMDLVVYLERCIQDEEVKALKPPPLEFRGSCEGCPYPDTCSYYRQCTFRTSSGDRRS